MSLSLHDIPVVLVDDEPAMLLGSRVILQSAGLRRIITVEDPRRALETLAGLESAVVVLDLLMPHLTGAELLPRILEAHPQFPVVVMTASQELETAVECMRQGAFDYLVKPVEETRFVSCVKRAWERQSLRRQVGALRASLLGEGPERSEVFANAITDSAKMKALFRYVEAVAGTGEPILITGETGVGKELIAGAVHRLSGLAGPFVAVNVAGLDGQVFSDTLFGHKKGAFTGADQSRPGLVQQSAGGTLFLDEVGDLKSSSQVKLLRLLQERQFLPLGSDQPVTSDARIVVATNRNLVKRVRKGKFRPDLFYRLSVHHVRIPPLRERREDLPLLVSHFLQAAAETMDKRIPTPPRELFTLLENYHFPGNIRELRSLIFDAVARHDSKVLSLKHIREAIQPGSQAAPSPKETTAAIRHWLRKLPGPFPTLKEVEQAQVEEAMRRANNNHGVAAGLLGMTRSALSHRLRKKRL